MSGKKRGDRKGLIRLARQRDKTSPRSWHPHLVQTGLFNLAQDPAADRTGRHFRAPS